MIDPESKENLLKSITPSQIENKMDVVDLISTVYINESIAKIFDLPLDNGEFVHRLSRLALSSSILDDSTINSFLIAESEQVLWENNDTLEEPNISNLVALTDIGFHYFLSNYDANAYIVAHNIQVLLNKTSNLSEIKKHYFYMYSLFIEGKLEKISPYLETKNKIEVSDKVFLFFINCLYDLSLLYLNIKNAYSGEIAHQFRKHAAQFSEKILVEIIVH